MSARSCSAFEVACWSRVELDRDHLGSLYRGDGARARISRPPSGIRFVVPKEGAVINMRSYCIPVLAPDPVTAHAWLNETLAPTRARRRDRLGSSIAGIRSQLPAARRRSSSTLRSTRRRRSGSAPDLDGDPGAGRGPRRRMGRGQAVISALFTAAAVCARRVRQQPGTRSPTRDHRRPSSHPREAPGVDHDQGGRSAALPKDASRVKVVTDTAPIRPPTAGCGSSPRKRCRRRSSPARGSLTASSRFMERRTRRSGSVVTVTQAR